MTRTRPGLWLSLLGALCAAPVWAAPQVDAFSPQGQAKGVRQAAARFTEPMVAFGDPRLADPFEVRCEGDETRLKEITAKAVEIRFNRFGKATLTLDNGHVWRQLDSDNRAIWLDDDKLYTVTVKRSAFGNYLLTVNELRRTIRVRRIQ